MLTGSMFLMTEPDQYIYNPSLHFKILFMMLAGLNVLVFYAIVFRKIKVIEAGADAPLLGKFIGGASLLLWIGVIVAGRMLTFYRPGRCSGATTFPFDCVPSYPNDRFLRSRLNFKSGVRDRSARMRRPYLSSSMEIFRARRNF